jgi:hypothetical protein
MPDDDMNFEEALRAMAQELGDSLQRALEQFDIDDVAGKLGAEASRAREWIQEAGDWLRAQTAGAGQPFTPDPGASNTGRQYGQRPAARGGEATFASAEPHPLDVPTEEQGLALAALDSGRWTVEPGTLSLAAHGDGPSPRNALGLVRELRARDWIAADGSITATGRHALRRWLESATGPRS